MWLYRGAQSAVFYYATCTPCASSIDRRKRKKDAARSKRDQEKSSALVTDQPRPFPQPTPFSTNKGWNEEISIGPGPPTKRGGPRYNANRVSSFNTDSVSASSLGSVGCLDGAPAQKKDRSSLKHPLGERWNWMRYQREDEPLWGENVEVKGSSVGISGRARADPGSSSKYYIARVPPVNDLHPPIVSGPKSRAETRWMLQPPPSAKVMAGKERFSSTHSSRGGMNDDEAIAEEGPSAGTAPDRKQSSPISPNSEMTTTVRPPPVTVASSDRIRKTPFSGESTRLSRPPPATLSTDGRWSDKSNLVISLPCDSRPASASSISSSIDSSQRSPSTPWQLPNTPISRPVSKATDSPSQKPPRHAISKTLSTVQHDTKDVQLLHLEINDDFHDVGLGRMEQIRPWRWSMDI